MDGRKEEGRVLATITLKLASPQNGRWQIFLGTTSKPHTVEGVPGCSWGMVTHPIRVGAASARCIPKQFTTAHGQLFRVSKPSNVHLLEPSLPPNHEMCDNRGTTLGDFEPILLTEWLVITAKTRNGPKL